MKNVTRLAAAGPAGCRSPQAGALAKKGAVAAALVVAMFGALGTDATPASAAVPGPGLKVEAVAGPTVFSPEHNNTEIHDDYTVFVTDNGSAPTGCTQEFIESSAKGATEEEREEKAEAKEAEEEAASKREKEEKGEPETAKEEKERIVKEKNREIKGKERNLKKKERELGEAREPDAVQCKKGDPIVSPVTIHDELPTGLVVVEAEGNLESEIAQGQDVVLPGIGAVSCEVVTATCTYGAPLLPGERLMLAFHVTVAPGTVGPVTNSVLVSGGGAPSTSANVTTAIGTAAESAAEPFGIVAFSAETTGVDGLVDAQAGDHPYASTVSFSMNTTDEEANSGITIGGAGYQTAGRAGGANVKDTVVDVPPGVTGDPTVVEKCPQYKAAILDCPASTQIGVAKIILGRRSTRTGENVAFGDPIYNLVPQKGYPAEFGIVLPGLKVLVPLYVSVIPEDGYEVRITTPGIPEVGTPVDVSVTLFGTPETNSDVYNEYSRAVTDVAPTAFLDNPVDCAAGPQTANVWADSWQSPGPWLADGQPDLSDPRWASRSATMFSSLEGCELLQFDPTLTVTPETTRADEPAGVSVEEHLPQAAQQFPALISPELKETTVTLPSGLSLDPSSGDGLEGCTEAEIGLGSGSAASCPNGSQIGTIEAETPLLPEALKGQVYLGTPHCDPCTTADASDGNMFRLFLQIEGSGVVIKQEGRIYTNASTGQLTTTFKDLPQLPTSNIKLHFNSGLRAGLATPQSCGTFTSTASLTPYSSPITQDATPVSQFNVDWNGNGEACPTVWPFAPQFEAGTSNPNAGQLSPLTVTFNREDREQDFNQIKVVTPPGLLGSLSGIPLCGEPQADLGTCSSASQIGEMTVAAGPGSHPYYQKGMVYLTGPYKGAPFGLSIVVPTKAGPFNLGNVVVRATVSVDPYTAALTVTTDPLPQILDGIPLRLRKTNVTINRPGFIFNPTDCAQLHITATVSGSQGTQTEESAPFAVSGCAGLSFDPKFTASTSGKTSRTDGASLDVKLSFPPGPQSNIAHVKVELPKQLPSRLSTLQKACTEAVFEANPANCPAASVIGAVQAVTPILPVKLVGPVYFVSRGNEAFPNLIAVLQGYGVRVNLIGDTFISKSGITSSTFTNIPDVPVSSFELFLPEGPYSALAANGNLCKDKLTLPTLFTAQDGAVFNQKVPIQITGCAKAKKTTKKKAKTAKKKTKKSHNVSHGKERKS
jgi:hypothetical protein